MPGLLPVRMGGTASVRVQGGSLVDLRIVGPWAARRLLGGGHTACARPWRQSQIGVVARHILDVQGGSGDSGIAAVAPGAGAGIRAALERAGDLPDGVVSGFGSHVFSGTRRPAGRLR